MKILTITASILLFAAPTHAQFTQEQCYARSDAHRTYLQHSTRLSLIHISEPTRPY